MILEPSFHQADPIGELMQFMTVISDHVAPVGVAQTFPAGYFLPVLDFIHIHSHYFILYRSNDRIILSG
jgi:hypothetical protein